MHDLCWRGSVQGSDGSGGVPQGDTRTQLHLPVTNVWILNQSCCCCWPLGQHSVSVAAELCSSQAVVGETRDKFHLLEQTFSFLFDLFIQHVHYHHDCLQALHRTPEPDPEQALTVKKEELRGRQGRADGQNEEKTLCNCGGLETWRWRSRPTGSEVIAAVPNTRFPFLNILFYWKLFCICRYVNKLSVTFLLHFLLRLLQLFGASLVFEAALGTNPPLVLPVSSGSLPSVGLHEKRDPYKNHIEFLTFLYISVLNLPPFI